MTQNYAKISTYFKNNLKIVIPLCITALLFNGLMCFIPVLEGKVINSIVSFDISLIVKLCIFYICLVLFVQINRFFKRYLVRFFGNKMALSMRRISLDNLLQEEAAYFEKQNVGEILNRNLTDIYDTTEGIRKMTTECFDTIVLLLGYLITMFFMDWQITCICFIFLTLSIAISQFMKKIVYKNNKAYKEYLSAYKEFTLRRLDNELYYRGFGVSDTYYKDFKDASNILRKKNTKALLYQSSLEPLYSVITYLGLFFIIFSGGKKVMNGTYEIGVLTAYLTTYFLVSKKSARVGKVFNAYQAFKVSWQRCKEYLICKEKEPCLSVLKDGKLVCKDFTFAYENGYHLPKLNFTAYKGDIVGVCGKVHTGKSTVLKALTGLYPYQGDAYLGDVPIHELTQSSIQYIGYCAPSVSLFSDTLKNNITLDRAGNLAQALEISNLSKEEVELMGGIDGIISHSIANISGGQQKRLQLARTVYPDTLLVLLDDVFQSVSKDMAENIMIHLQNLKDRIIILVSNQSEILKKTTKILYLQEDGFVLDSYQNLLENRDFKQMVEA